MKGLLLSFLACFLSVSAEALEYKVLLENERVHVGRAKIRAHEQIGLHRDNLPHLVIAIKAGTITRLECDGTEVNVEFPFSKTVWRPVDPPGLCHKSVNRSSDPIDLIIVKLGQDFSYDDDDGSGP